MSLGKAPWSFDEHNQADHLIDAEGNHIGDMRTPALAAIAVAAVNTAAASYDNARKAALWDRLMAIWLSDDGEPTKAYDPEVLERIAMLVNEWQGFAGGGRCACTHTVSEHTPAGCTKCKCVEAWAAGHPLEVCDPVELPPGAVPFYENDQPAPSVPGTFSNKVDWGAGIDRMATIKAAREAIVASAAPDAPGPIWLGEMRSMLAQAARISEALAVQAELAADLRSDLQINLNRMGLAEATPPRIVHLLIRGFAHCGLAGTPSQWSPGNVWAASSDAQVVNCPGCKPEAERIIARHRSKP